jgi:predicted lactoylglutathione lyase
MPTQVFINLPVKDLEKSKAFFAHLGYSFNAQFTNEQAACMVISDTIADGHASKEVIICLSCDSRAAVDEMVKKAWEAGGTAPMPAQDHGFMYYHSFEDLDGHHWEVMFMEPNHVQA